MRWLGLALLLTACSPVIPTMPDQAAATTIVWNEQYGMMGPPPTIEWETGSTLDCADGKGWTSYQFSPPLCVAGLSLWGPFVSQIAWPPGSVFSTTAFAHELCHQRDGVISDGADSDPNHTGVCFVEGGLVDKANAALAEIGL